MARAAGWRACDAPATRKALRLRYACWIVTVVFGVALVASAAVLWIRRSAPVASEAILMGAGVVVLAVATIAACRLRALARTLRDNPWVVAESKRVELAVDGSSGRSVLRMIELSGAPDDGSVLAVPLSVRAQLLDDLVPAAWIAGSDRCFAAAAPGGGRLRRMRRARLTGSRRLEAPPLSSRLDNAD